MAPTMSTRQTPAALATLFASDREAAMAFVDRRIADVMTFEKWKATTKLRPSQFAEQAAKALGKALKGSAVSSTLVAVSALAVSGLLVEIESTAVVRS